MLHSSAIPYSIDEKIMKKFFRPAAQLLAVLLLASCNIYAPFNSKSSEIDYVEEGTKCLNQGDFACAIANYQSLPDGDLKNQKLCTGYLAKAGLTLNVLLNIVTQQNQTMIGALAQALIPWSATRQSDAENAKSFCVTYQTANPTNSNAALFATMGYLVDCAVVMAKTDQYVGVDDNDAVCNTAGNNNGTLTSSDISGTGAANFMCTQDTITCGYDIAEISTPAFKQSLRDAGLSNIAGALDAVPSDLTTKLDTSSASNTTAAADTYRAALATTVP
jgi:hypothetical protein